MAGYSNTPLQKKLGIKDHFRIALINAPKNFPKLLGSLPATVVVVKRPVAGLNLILFFVDAEEELSGKFALYAKTLTSNGMIWIAWPKKSSGVTTNLTFDQVQHIGLHAGLVDVKICAIDETWSGLKFVYRVVDREKTPRAAGR